MTCVGLAVKHAHHHDHHRNHTHKLHHHHHNITVILYLVPSAALPRVLLTHQLGTPLVPCAFTPAPRTFWPRYMQRVTFLSTSSKLLPPQRAQHHLRPVTNSSRLSFLLPSYSQFVLCASATLTASHCCRLARNLLPPQRAQCLLAGVSSQWQGRNLLQKRRHRASRQQRQPCQRRHLAARRCWSRRRKTSMVAPRQLGSFGGGAPIRQ